MNAKIFIKIGKILWPNNLSTDCGSWGRYFWVSDTINLGFDNQEFLTQEEIGQEMGGN